MKRNWLAIVSFALTLAPLVVPAASAAPEEKLPEGAEIVALEVQPAEIALDGQYAYAQVLVTAQLADGDSMDVTRMVEPVVTDDLATVSPTLLVRPKADGQGQITFAVGGKTVAVPLAVSGLAGKFEPSFVRDVMPVLSKMGCNAGTCHGSLKGKNGFKLSLRGYDPLYDHRALTDDVASRRINRAAPDQSLMLLKPAGVIPHVGGVLTQPGEPYYEMIRSWISGGVKLDLDSPRVASIEIFPKNPIVPLPGMTQQMKVLATYTDGSVRDVTLEAFIESGNTEVAEPDKRGLVTVIRRGEAAVLARYEGCVHGHHDHRDGRSQRLRVEGRAGQQLHRRARLQQAETSQDAAQRSVHRRRVHSPRLARPGRPAAHERRGPRLPGRRARHEGQARRAGRSAGRQRRLRRAVDQQVGRSAAGESQVPGRAGGLCPARLDQAGRGQQHALRRVRVRRFSRPAVRRSRTRRRRTTRCCARRRK